MGNRLSSEAVPSSSAGHDQSPREVTLASAARGAAGKYNTSTSASAKMAPSSWLMDRLEKKGVMSKPVSRRRLSSAKDSDVEGGGPMLRKPHTLSEATTMSMGESPLLFQTQYSRGLSSGDESTGDATASRQPEDEEEDVGDQMKKSSEPPRRSSVWQELTGLVMSQRVVTQCCGTPNSGSMTPPGTPTSHQRKRRRSFTSTIAEVENKHRAFWELVQKLLALNDVVAMIRELQDYLVDEVGASQCAVFLVDPNRNSMSRVSRGQENLSSISQHRGLVGHVIATKGSFCRQLFAQDRNYDAEIDLPQENVFQKLISVPLLENNNVYAVVQLTTKDTVREPEMDALDIKLLTWLGPILSSCMRKCIEFHDVLLSDRTQKALLHIISSSDTEDTVLNLVDGVIAGACHITKSERLSLFMIDWETEELWTLSSSYHEETIRVPLKGSTLGHVARHRLTLNIADADNDSRYIADLDNKRGIKTRCALYVPVGVENGANCDEHSRPMAVLEILNKDGADSFSLDDECAFEAFASEVAVILRRRSNEIEYIKLLADTRAEKVLAQRAKSQVNLLECYTEYVANANANHAADRLRHSFFKSHSRECLVCTSDQKSGTANCTSIDRVDADTQDGSGPPRTAEALALSPPLQVTVGPPPMQVPLWDFNIFATEPESLPVLVRDMFLDFRVHEILQTDEVTLRNFIFAVKDTYHPNPFHNYLHAVSVVHMAYTILKTTEASKMLQPLDVAACLIAAYCHDVDHPGHTNSYEIVSKSPLAMIYSDDSVLERHHACTTFRILFKDKNANILQNLSTSDFRYVRKMIVTAILSTDMAQHFKMCESMEKMLHPTSHHKPANAIAMKRESAPCVVESANPSSTNSGSAEVSSEIISVVREAVFQAEAGNIPTPGNSSSKNLSSRTLGCSTLETCMKQSPYQCNFNGSLEERTFLVKAIVHASDLCGQTFPKPVALKWSNMISKEFAYQALLEQAENLPVSYQHMDDPLQMVEGQHFFAHKIVLPLWSLVYEMFPEVEVCIKNLTNNVAHYEHEIQRLKHHRQSSVGASAASDSAGSGDGNMSDCSNCSGGDNGWCHSDDEGMAVPGLARCTPAKFNSFRAMKSSSLSRSVSTSVIEDGTFGARAIEAIELARAQSEFCRSPSSSTLSSAEGDAEQENEEVFEIADVDSPELLPGLS